MAIRIGIVGCGAIASYLHAPAIIASKQFDLTAFVDIDLSRAAELGAKFDVETTANNLRSIAHLLDAVVIAVPPDHTVSIFKQALDSGLHTLIEKPLANTEDECIEIIGLAEIAETSVAVCHQYRFWPNRMALQKLFSNEKLELPLLVSVSLGNPYSWNSVSGYTVRRDMVPGGILINAGIHPLDTLISWFGDPLDVDYWDDSYNGLESNVRLKLHFDGGVTCDFRISRTCTLENVFKLQGKDYSISLNNYDSLNYLFSDEHGEFEELIESDSEWSFLSPVIDLYDDFSVSITNETLPRVGPAEAMRVIRVIEHCYQQKKIRKYPEFAPVPGLTW